MSGTAAGDDDGSAAAPSGPTAKPVAPSMLNPRTQAITLVLLSTRGMSSRFRVT